MISKFLTKWLQKIFLIFSMILTISSILSFIYGKFFFQKTIEKSLIIIPNTSQLQIWANPPIIVYRKYFFFHVQNPTHFLNGSKPILVERGPYVYREVIEKRNIKFINETTIKYNPVITLYFEPSLSIGNETDTVTIPNIPFVSMIEKTLHEDNTIPFNFIFDYLETKLFISRSIKDIVSGYYEPLMDLAMMSSEKITSNQFSITREKNGTTWQELVVKTGGDKWENLGRIITWNGKHKLDYWYSEKANQFKGRDGSFNEPFMRREKEIEIFNGEMCRSYKLTYLRDNEVDGIPGFDFHLLPDIFSMSKMQQEGYCDYCLGNGVYNMSNCQGGISSFLSQPHFLNADQKFLDSIIGLKPNKEEHDFIVNYEPISGASLKGNVRLQLNFYIHKNDKIDIVKNIRPMLLPFFWFDEDISVKDNDVKEKLNKLRLAYITIQRLPFIFLISAFLFFIMWLIPTIFRYSNNNVEKEKHSCQHSSVLLLNVNKQKALMSSNFGQ